MVAVMQHFRCWLPQTRLKDKEMENGLLHPLIASSWYSTEWKLKRIKS